MNARLSTHSMAFLADPGLRLGFFRWSKDTPHLFKLWFFGCVKLRLLIIQCGRQHWYHRSTVTRFHFRQPGIKHKVPLWYRFSDDTFQ